MYFDYINFLMSWIFSGFILNYSLGDHVFMDNMTENLQDPFYFTSPKNDASVSNIPWKLDTPNNGKCVILVFDFHYPINPVVH